MWGAGFIALLLLGPPRLNPQEFFPSLNREISIRKTGTEETQTFAFLVKMWYFFSILPGWFGGSVKLQNCGLQRVNCIGIVYTITSKEAEGFRELIQHGALQSLARGFLLIFSSRCARSCKASTHRKNKLLE
jgi:hypothetical protein